MVELLEDSPISSKELWMSHIVIFEPLVTCLIKALRPQLVSLGGRPDRGRVFVVLNFFPFQDDGSYHTPGHF